MTADTSQATKDSAPQDRNVFKLARDFALGVAIFAATVTLWDVTISPASNAGPSMAMTLVDPAAMPSLDAWSRQVWVDLFSPTGQSRLTMLALVGTGFATAVAFNLALVRHLRSTYARPVRSSKR